MPVAAALSNPTSHPTDGAPVLLPAAADPSGAVVRYCHRAGEIDRDGRSSNHRLVSPGFAADRQCRPGSGRPRWQAGDPRVRARRRGKRRPRQRRRNEMVAPSQPRRTIAVAGCDRLQADVATRVGAWDPDQAREGDRRRSDPCLARLRAPSDRRGNGTQSGLRRGRHHAPSVPRLPAVRARGDPDEAGRAVPRIHAVLASVPGPPSPVTVLPAPATLQAPGKVAAFRQSRRTGS